MRLPSEVGLSPAVLTSHPSRVASSLSLPISFMSRSLGFWPVVSSTFTIDSNRIFVSSGWVVGDDRFHQQLEQLERLSPSQVARLGRNRVRDAFLRDVELGAHHHLADLDRRGHRAGRTAVELVG